ncbi:MAG TPA: excinuclease ABC subunit UvrA, partial [Anaerovoracaceae bacterium]|nr:excinuclease ABC subunit UvrA [Anaerovoracaceae bacterium]
EMEPRSFSFNSPFGACPACHGLGFIQKIDPDLVVNDPALSIFGGALTNVFASLEYSGFYRQLIQALADDLGVDTSLPYSDLPAKFKKELFYGTKGRRLNYTYVSRTTGNSSKRSDTFEGVIHNLQRRYEYTNSDYIKEKLEAYMNIIPCDVCGGKRLKPEILAVTVGDRNIADLTDLSILKAIDFMSGLEDRLSEKHRAIARMVMKEIRERLAFLRDVGLDYLTLSRASASLSGGEAQRIRLATQIGSSLVGVLYILDEPSIGLHQKDNAKLLQALRELTDLGNTLIVVEHDEETMMAADQIVDIGPGAGVEGGYLVAQGSLEDIKACPESVTGRYLSGELEIPIPKQRREGNGKSLIVRGAKENNLQDLDVEIPLGKMICVTGVSGSGKSSLINEILYKALAEKM